MKRNRPGFEVMRRVLLALLLREMKTRFGKYQLGYAWALIEPIGIVAVLILIFTILQAPGYPGLSFPVFLAVGVVTYDLFSEISNRSIKAMEANAALFNYRPVKPIDTVLTRALLECILHLAVLLVLVGGYRLLGGDVAIYDMPKLLLVYILLTALSTGVGILFMLITDIYSDAERVLPLVTRPLFFISGVFFSIDNVPRDYWHFLLWNPIFHAIELARESFSEHYDVHGANMGFLAIVSGGLLTLSLFAYRTRETRLRLR